MTAPRRPKRVTTSTWKGLSAPARADLYASSFTSRDPDLPDEPSYLEGIEQFFGISFDVEADPARGAAVRAIVTKAFLAGTEREAQYESALEAKTAICDRFVALLRENKIPVPTDPIPSDPGEL